MKSKRSMAAANQTLVQPPTLFVGRDAEIARLQALLPRVPVALICGVAGVGKSALAYRIAADWRGRQIHRRIAARQTLGALCDDLRRECAASDVVPEAHDDAERLADLARRLDDTVSLVVLDDLHHLARPDAEELVDGLARLLRRGRVIATSREALVRRADGPDCAELRLAGIDEASERALWSALDELYGPSEGFAEARRAARGNPLLLRRAHAGGWLDVDPIAAAIERLSVDERRVAGALALTELRLPASSLAGLATQGGREALEGLLRSLVLELGPDGSCTLHDLFREAVRKSMSPETKRELHAALVELVDALPVVDPVLQVREVVGHLRALDDHQGATRYVIAHATQLVRLGAAGELLAAIEAIPPEQRTVDLRLLRARTLVRRLDFQRAHQELVQLSQETKGRLPEVQLALGTIAHLSGRIPEAVALLRPLLDAADLPAGQRMRARITLAYTLAFRGRGDEARQLLATWTAEADARARVSYAWARGFTFWIDERSAEALEALEPARTDEEPGLHDVGVQMLWADARARLGRFDGCDEALARAEQSLEWKQDLRLRMEVRQHRTFVSYERGNRLEAIAELEQLIRDADRVGAPTGRLWTQVWLARAWLALGRRRAALALLDAIEREARPLDAQHVVAAAIRSRALDPVAQLHAPLLPPPPEAKRGEAVRWRSWAALATACRADAVETEALLDLNARAAVGDDYAFDRALAALARAALARAADDRPAVEKWTSTAAREASAGGVDADSHPASVERARRRPPARVSGRPRFGRAGARRRRARQTPGAHLRGPRWSHPRAAQPRQDDVARQASDPASPPLLPGPSRR